MPNSPIHGYNLLSAQQAADKARSATKHRDAVIAEMVASKTASLRELAEATGLSHSAIAKIAARA